MCFFYRSASESPIFVTGHRDESVFYECETVHERGGAELVQRSDRKIGDKNTTSLTEVLQAI